MNHWTATEELRFVGRREHRTFHPDDGYEIVNILQQKWKHNEASYYGGRIVSEEWRDVPIVEEE